MPGLSRRPQRRAPRTDSGSDAPAPPTTAPRENRQPQGASNAGSAPTIDLIEVRLEIEGGDVEQEFAALFRKYMQRYERLLREGEQPIVTLDELARDSGIPVERLVELQTIPDYGQRRR